MTRHRSWERANVYQVLAPIVVFFLLCLFGVTQSSIGADPLREQPGDPYGAMLGQAQNIRSDEFLTNSPTLLGVMATGSTDTLNPLAAQQGVFSGLPRGIISSVVLPDSLALELGPWLPDSMLFAAKWWLPFLLLVLSMPVWFRRVTGSGAIGWWAAALVIASPSSVWWSFIHVQVLAFAFAGAVALQSAVRASQSRRFAVSALWVLACAVLLTRTAFTYQPWVVVLVPPVLLATVIHALGLAERRAAARVTVGIAVGMTCVVLAAVLLENRAEIANLTSTVYPGLRRTTGAPNPVQDVWGATALSALPGAVVNGANASEISSSFAVILAWVAVLLAVGPGLRHRTEQAVVVSFAAVTAFWVAWSTVSFGAWGSHIPIVNQVPSPRAAEVLGYLAIVLICLLLPRLRDRPRWSVSVVSAGVVTALAANGGSVMRATNLPSVSLTTIWVSSLAAGLVVLLITRAPRRPWGYGLGVVGALVLVWNVNPVIVGTADLRASPTAKELISAGDVARADGTYYASDTYGVDALFLATGVPSVSGRQVSGPDAAAWREFLPETPERRWNRGAAFIWFQWTDQRRLTVTNPSPDVVLVTGSPCTVARRIPAMTRVVSTHELTDPCLTPEGRLTWAGVDQFVYATSSGA